MSAPELWDVIGECATGIGQAITEGDNIAGVLWSRGFLANLSLLDEPVRAEIADICLHPEKADQ